MHREDRNKLYSLLLQGGFQIIISTTLPQTQINKEASPHVYTTQ